MPSSKRLFAGRLFAGRLFAPALWRGVGVDVATPFHAGGRMTTLPRFAGQVRIEPRFGGAATTEPRFAGQTKVNQ